jgi:hypothetical protein
MPRYKNDLPESDIIFIATFPVPKLPEYSAAIIHYTDHRIEHLKGAEIVAAMEIFADKENNGKNCRISIALQEMIKADLSTLFAMVDPNHVTYQPKIKIKKIKANVWNAKIITVLVDSTDNVKNRISQGTQKLLDGLK